MWGIASLIVRRTSRAARIILIAVSFAATHWIRFLLDPGAFRLIAGHGGGGSSGPGGSAGRLEAAANIDLFQAARGTSLVAFYNLFIPHGDTSRDAIGVVEDQMGQVADALRRLEGGAPGEDVGNGSASDNGGKRISGEGIIKRGVVYYNSIGNGDALPPDEFEGLCRRLHPGLECRRVDHYENATESVTLASLHEFCHAADETRRVVYLHSKGTHHDHGKQRPWRRSLTSAALHPDCLHPPEDRCDVCGAQYYTIFASMFPGNMWTAKCSYVRKLLRPNEGGEYSRRREGAIRRFMLLKTEGTLRNTLGFHQNVFYGLDRYQWEHWVGSHPSIRPCDVHGTDVSFMDMTERAEEVAEGRFLWGMGPRRLMIFDVPGRRRPWLSNKDDESNLRQYYYLAGNMVKWLGLYDEVPPLDSWVWDHFPAGKRWRELVRRNGKDAMEELIRTSESSSDPALLASKNRSELLIAPLFNEEVPSGPGTPLVVFYHVSFQPGEDIKEAEEAVAQQLDALISAAVKGRRLLLYYLISGGSSEQREMVSSLCKGRSAQIACRKLEAAHDDSGYTSGEMTLSLLRKFCVINPSSDVAYVTSQGGPPGELHHNTTWARDVASAVTSEVCRPSEECNVCGFGFWPLPFPHFEGGAFSASCRYVADLLPPWEFGARLRDVAGDALLARLRGKFTTELAGFDARILGLGRHSADHWIGAHPDLRPCDVAGMLDARGRKGRDAPPEYVGMGGERESLFRSRRKESFREYYYLAGNVFRWHGLYGKVPDAGSWAWERFPDGRVWETAARKSRGRAVDDVARQIGAEVGTDQFWVE